MKFLLYRLAGYNDKHKLTSSEVEKRIIEREFFETELPALIIEMEERLGYHGNHSSPLTAASQDAS